MANRFLNNIRINDEYTLPSADGTADQIIVTDGAGNLSFVDTTTISVGESEQVHIACKNTSGVAISKGDPVYITGTVGTSYIVQIAKADASNSAKMPAVGLAETDLGINAEGFVIVSGVLKNLTTDPLSTGDGTPSSNDTVYVKAGGGLTRTKPTGSSNLIQNVGKVGRVNSANAGSIAVSTIMRTNDVPNLTTGKIWVGSSTYTTESGVVHLDEGNGRMGIGTSSPVYPLHVVGNIRQEGSSYILDIKNGNGITGSNHLDISASASYINLRSPNNSIYYRAGTDHVFQSGNGSTEYMRIDTNGTYAGNVGIGTTAPVAKLHIDGGDIYTINNAGDPRLVLGDSLSNGNWGYIQWKSANDRVDIGTSGTPALSVLESGNVGVGVTSPDSKLEVAGSVHVSGNTATRLDLDAGVKITGQYNVNSGNEYTYLQMYNGSNASINIGTKHSLGYISFESGNGSYVERMRITNTGNVGIGTTSPSSKLHINGGTGSLSTGLTFGDGDTGIWESADDVLRFSTSSSTRMIIDSSGDVGIGTSSPSEKLHVAGSGILLESPSYADSGLTISDDIYDYRIGTVPPAINTNFIHIQRNGSNTVFKQSSGAFLWQTAGSEYMRITSTGNVGIGITSPTYKLDVSGNSRIQGQLQITSGSSIRSILDENGTEGRLRLYNGSNWGLIARGVGNSPVIGAYHSGSFRISGFESSNGDTLSTYALATFNFGGSGGANGYLDLKGRLSIGLDNDIEFAYSNSGGNGLKWQGSNKMSAAILPVDEQNYQRMGLGFFTGDSTTTPADATERMRITRDGKVGIGTTSPSYKLELGSGDFSLPLGSFIRFGSQIGITKASNSKLSIYGGTGATTAGGVDLYRWDGAAYSTALRLSNTGQIQFDEYGSGTFTGTATQRLAVDSSGNVIEIPIGSGPVDGSGTANYVTKWSDADTITNSLIYDDGTNIVINGADNNSGKADFAVKATGTTANVAVSLRSGQFQVGNTDINYEGRLGTSSTAFTVSSWARDIILSTDSSTTSHNIRFYPTNAGSEFEAMRIASTGNVGIGTTSPAKKLEINVGNASSDGILVVGSLNPHIEVQDSTNSVRTAISAEDSLGKIGTISSTDLKVVTGNSEKMRITSTGNVGIGTTSPSSRLHVEGSAFLNSGILKIVNNSITNYYDSNQMNSYGTYYDWKFSGTNVMRINSSGNVGIGTTSPIAPLNVVSAADTVAVFNSTDNKATITIKDDDTTGYISAENFRMSFGANAGANANNLNIDLSNNRVGIGTTSPASKLHVQGDTYIQNGNLLMSAGVYGIANVANTAQKAGFPSSGNFAFQSVNVGIGTTTPAAKLDVNGDSSYSSDYNFLSISGTKTGGTAVTDVKGIDLSIGSGDIVAGNDIANLYGAYINNNTSGGSASVIGNWYGVYVPSADANRVSNRVSAYFGDNVGIGTTSPTDLLHLEGASTPTLKIVDTTNTTITELYSNDFDTYLANESSGRVFIRTGGSNGFVVDSAGDVGIGTTNPIYKLDIQAESPAIRVRDISDANSFLVGADNSGGYLGMFTNDSLRVYTNSLERIRITSTGNVGIGTTTPAAKLDVNGDINISTTSNSYKINNINALDHSTTYTRLYNPEGAIILYGGDSADRSNYYDNDVHRFRPAGGASYYGLWNSTGFGIGTTGPAYKLDVNGTIRAVGNTYLQSDTYIGTSTSAYMQFNRDGYNYIAATQTNGAMVFRTGGTNNRMIITAAGDVGIGTLSPAQKLDVNGNIKMTETAATTDTDKIVVSDSGVLKYRTGAQILSDIGGQASISAPNAPTNLSLTVVSNTINVTFNASTTSDIDAYLVYSSVDGSDYGLISIIPPDDFSATMSIIDDAFSVSGTQAYRVYAMKLGNMSSALTGSISYTVSTPLEPTNMSVIPLNTAYFVQWDPPSSNARFVTAYNVYKHEASSQASLARASATLVYSGMNTNYMYQVSGANNTNYHQFWVETTVA